MTNGTTDIYAILLSIKEQIGNLNAVTQSQSLVLTTQSIMLNEIKEQTTKTNGRVNKLEDAMVTRGELLNDIKKKVYGDEETADKNSVQGRLEIRKVIWGGLIGIVGTILTLILTKYI
jgi:hypothetical protein